MPVRKIPSNRRVPTGYFFSYINGKVIDCESPVERDFYLTLEFDDTIEKYEEQPVAVKNPLTGKVLYPDCLITYKSWTKKKPCITEVKSEEELKDPIKAREFKIKCRILKNYAKANNMDFKVVVDTAIRGQYLENLKFLYRYWGKPENIGAYRDLIVKTIREGETVTVSMVIDEVTKNKKERAHILPLIWHLLSIGTLKTDLKIRPITNSSLLEVNNEGIVSQER
jgi:hypothetical protein